MKKTIQGILAIGLLMVGSCSKTNQYQGGDWSFKGVTYVTTTCAGSSATGSLNASSETVNSINAASYGTLVCYFSDTLPTVSGTFTVVAGTIPGAPGQICISATTGGDAPTTYYGTGGNGAEQVTVKVVNLRLTISGTGIALRNTTNAIDSAPLTFNITQLQ